MGATQSKLSDHLDWIDRLLDDSAVDQSAMLAMLARERRDALMQLRGRADRAELVAFVCRGETLGNWKRKLLLDLLCVDAFDAVFATLVENDNATILALIDETRSELALRSDGALNKAMSANANACVRLLLGDASKQRRLNLLNFPLLAAIVASGDESLLKQVHHERMYCTDAATGETLLHALARQGDERGVRLLLAHGVLPTATTASGETALFLAMRAGHANVATELVRTRAGVLVRNLRGETALDVCSDAAVVAAVRAELERWPVPAQRAAVLHFFFGAAASSSSPSDFRIQVCSDLHVEFADNEATFQDALEKAENCDYLALLGDIGVCGKPSYRAFVQSCASAGYAKVFVVLGNHEYYRGDMRGSLREAKDVCDSRPDVLTLMHRSSVVLRAGERRLRVVGSTLWSHVPSASASSVTASLNDYKMISNTLALKVAQLTADNIESIVDEPEAPELRAALVQYVRELPSGSTAFAERLLRDESSLLSVAHTNAIHAADLAFFNAECKAARDAGEECVVLCHHAPLIHDGVGDPNYWFLPQECAFATDLRASLIEPNPNLRAIVYGHTHWPQDLTIVSSNGATCRVVSNPRGYKTESRSTRFAKAFVLSL